PATVPARPSPGRALARGWHVPTERRIGAASPAGIPGGFRIARYGSQPGGLGVVVDVQGPWVACASERYAALGVAVEALRQWQLGDRQRQQRGLPSWSPLVERGGQPRTTGARSADQVAAEASPYRRHPPPGLPGRSPFAECLAAAPLTLLPSLS